MARKLALVALLSLLVAGATSVFAIPPPQNYWICSCAYCNYPDPNRKCSTLDGEIHNCMQYYPFCA